MKPDQLFYLYCIADKDIGAGTILPPGIENQPVHLLEHQGRSAIYSIHPRELFQGEEAESNLQEIQWITPRAAAHDEIIKRVVELASVYPLPFGTLFSSLERVREEIYSKQETLQQAFDRVRGGMEWSVRILLDREAAVNHRVEEEVREGGIRLPDTPGARHMQLQRLRQNAKQGLITELDHQLSEILESITPFSREERARKSTLEDRDSNLEGLAHWSFLVDDRERTEFDAAIEQVRGRAGPLGLHVMVSGPWPPYSFSTPQPVSE